MASVTSTTTGNDAQHETETGEQTRHQSGESPAARLFRQLVSYGIIGVMCSGLDTVLFALFTYVLHGNDLVSNFVSVSIGITLSFFLNRRFTFKVSDHAARRYVTFFAVGMCGLALSEGMLMLAAAIGMEAIVMKVISIFVVAAFQFVLNKLISFRPAKEQA